MSLVRCHDSNIYPCVVHDRLVYGLATPTSFLKTDKPVIKSITISDEMIIANNRLSISETFWFRLIKSIFQNRLLFNSPPPPPNECTAHFSSRLSCKRVDLCLTILIRSDYYTLPWIFYYTWQSTFIIKSANSTFSLVTLQMTGLHMQVISYLETSLSRGSIISKRPHTFKCIHGRAWN